MVLFGMKYTVRGWRGRVYSLTAKQLYNQVMEDSQSDYNWIAPASELVRICNHYKFPVEYARAIQIAILNCFAHLECKKEIDSYHSSEDDEAVNYCYNVLADTTTEGEKARNVYLRAVIVGVTKYHFKRGEFGHYGPTYLKICDEWINLMFEEYSQLSTLDFKRLRKTLHASFNYVMRKGESDGIFGEKEHKRVYDAIKSLQG